MLSKTKNKKTKKKKKKKRKEKKQSRLPAFRKMIQITQGIKRTLFNWTKIAGKAFSSRQPPSIKLTKDSWFNCFLLYCTLLEKNNYIENLHVLSCSDLLKSVLLIPCVFWIFIQNTGSQLCFRFYSLTGTDSHQK